jgi:hypothetical protein
LQSGRELPQKNKRDTKIKLRVPSWPLWLNALIWACHPVNCHPTISHGFPPAEQTDVVPEQPRALAVVPDALPAAVAAQTDVVPARVEAAVAAQTDVVPARVEAAVAYTYCAQSAVAGQA